MSAIGDKIWYVRMDMLLRRKISLWCPTGRDLNFKCSNHDRVSDAWDPPLMISDLMRYRRRFSTKSNQSYTYNAVRDLAQRCHLSIIVSCSGFQSRLTIVKPIEISLQTNVHHMAIVHSMLCSRCTTIKCCAQHDSEGAMLFEFDIYEQTNLSWD